MNLVQDSHCVPEDLFCFQIGGTEKTPSPHSAAILKRNLALRTEGG